MSFACLTTDCGTSTADATRCCRRVRDSAALAVQFMALSDARHGNDEMTAVRSWVFSNRMRSSLPSGASEFTPPRKVPTKNANESSGVTLMVPDGICSGEADTHSLVSCACVLRMRQAPTAGRLRRHSSSLVLADELSHRATCFISLRAMPTNLPANVWVFVLPEYA